MFDQNITDFLHEDMIRVEIKISQYILQNICHENKDKNKNHLTFKRKYLNEKIRVKIRNDNASTIKLREVKCSFTNPKYFVIYI